jgi:GNAT superfamily N-acetyltransferase
VTGVRPAQVGHAEAIAAVHVAAWQHAYQEMLPPELLASLSVESRAQRWRQQLADARGGHTWVVGEPVRGFVSVGPSRDDDAADDIRELYALYVHPADWGTGLGSRLMTVAAEVLGNGATLWVLDANERARRFYERHGWRPDGGRKQETRGAAVLDGVRYRLERVRAAD